MADDTTPQKDPEIQKLEAELAKLKLQNQIAEEKAKLEPKSDRQKELDDAEMKAKIAEQKKKALEASTPATEAKALEGKTTIDDKVTIEAQTMANDSLKAIAGQIANEVQAALGETTPKILIYNDKDLGALVAYRAFLKQIAVLEGAYNSVAPGPQQFIAPLAIPVAVAAVKSVIDLLALFRSDTEIKGVAITMDELALVSEVSGDLAKKNRPVYVSQIYPTDALPAGPAGETIQKRLDSADAAAVQAAARVKKIADADQKSAAEARLKQLDDIRKGYLDALTKIPTDGTALLSILIRGESLATGFGANADVRILYLKILNAGGSNRVTRNLWTGSHLAHSGGAIANYILFAADGSVASGRTVAAYSGYTEHVQAQPLNR